MNMCNVYNTEGDQSGFMITVIDKNSVHCGIFQNELNYVTKVNLHSEEVKKWAETLNQIPEEYWKVFINALENNVAEECKNNFVIDENYLHWKQYFPHKNITGRKGKFLIVRESSNSAFCSMFSLIEENHKSQKQNIKELEKKIDALSQEKEEAVKLAREAVMVKEEFENDVYSKFTMILNAKKRQCNQSNEDASDPYDVDTDVDDMDQDKPKKTKKNKRSGECPMEISFSDSQDLLSTSLAGQFSPDL